MQEPVIRVENISKKYNLLHKTQEAPDSLVSSIAQRVKKTIRGGKTSQEDFWALKDISFDVQQGERLGIIGRNGAGKSTLLKILSRIVKPTTGTIEYYGRMASLLEVGTGFHGDLSGRENIYLNGSILGMTRAEIDRQFDAIVAFSEVEQFLDTPVKRYSSGMYVRLAFSVAAHLNPEILIVDEVLAVGDAAFQKKCLGKMNEISKEQGKTILFVSHSMQSVQKICNTGLLLQKGTMVEKNTIDKIVTKYIQIPGLSQAQFEVPPEMQAEQAFAHTIRVESESGELLQEIPVGDNWQVRINYRINKPLEHFIVGFGIVSAFDQPIRTSWTIPQDAQPGEYEVVFKNNDLMLTSGLYKIVIGLSENQRTFQYLDNLAELTISDAGDVAKNNRIVNTQSGLILNPMEVFTSKLE